VLVRCSRNSIFPGLADLEQLQERIGDDARGAGHLKKVVLGDLSEF
jgi:hypothetical protein